MFKVLLVDDEPWTLIGLEKTLPWTDYNMEIVKKADDSFEALDFIQNNKVDILFTDMRMPGLDGMALMEKISKLGLKPKIIVVSGFSDFQYVQKAIREGAFDYLLKPIEIEKGTDLLKRLSKSLEAGNYPRKEITNTVIDNSQFKELVEYLKENYRESHTLNDLAERFELNSSYCSQLFKRYFSCSYSAYLTTLRLEKAEILLKNEALSIEEVAGRCGFSDYYYFNKVFKKYIGLTPSKYRKQ